MSNAPSPSETQLLQTKFYVPAPGGVYVERPRLVARLNEIARVPLTLVAAPAGFGKTTLLATWCVQTKEMPVAWLTLEPSDDESTRFLTYVCAALQTADAQLGADAMSLLRSSPNVPPQLVLTTLLNSFAMRREPVALVLDDAHVLEAEGVTALLAFLVEHCPPALHLVVATRADPDLPLARYRARGQLQEIRAHDLRFTFDEAATFLNQVMGLDLGGAQIQQLEARTEGWIAGLQLAALSMRDHKDRAQFIAAFHGSHRFVLDYLMEQVLSQQTPETRDFLVQTSILARMNAALCRAVTGQGDAQAQLEWLESHNLFLIPLDDDREWYRYHSLFAEVLQHRLRKTEQFDPVELHRRAAEWFRAQGDLADAVQHAIAAGDFEMTAQILERVGADVILAGQTQMAGRWIASLPSEMLETRPMLAVADAILNLLTDRLDLSEKRLETAERILERNGTTEQLAFVRTWQAILQGERALQSGDLVAMVAASRRGLEVAVRDDPARLPLLVRVARAFQYTGDVREPFENEIAMLIPFVRRTTNLFTQLNSVMYLAHLQTLQGRLREAMKTFALARELMPSVGTETATIIHPVYYFGRAAIFYAWNDLDATARELELGFATFEIGLSVDADGVMLGYVTKTQLEMARGNFGAASEMVKQLAQVAARRSFFSALVGEIEALRAEVELGRGNFETAWRWAKTISPPTGEATDFMRERERLTWVRVGLAGAEHGREVAGFDDMARLLEAWGNDAEAKARRDSAIEIWILRARVALGQGNRTLALDLLAHAVELGEGENYVRVFVDGGEALRPLWVTLQEKGRPGSRAFIESILAAMGGAAESKRTDSKQAVLREGLSAREVEVLRLIVKGASNQEIADTLVIALPTVKRHISNIYDKLDVTSRTLAVARAQELRLV